MEHATSQAPVLRVSVSSANSSDLIAAVSGKAIRVIAGCFVAAGAVTMKLQSGGSSDLTGAMTMATGTPQPFSYNPTGHVQTAIGEKLNIVHSSAVQISGWLVYQLIG